MLAMDEGDGDVRALKGGVAFILFVLIGVALGGIAGLVLYGLAFLGGVYSVIGFLDWFNVR